MIVTISKIFASTIIELDEDFSPNSIAVQPSRRVGAPSYVARADRSIAQMTRPAALPRRRRFRSPRCVNPSRAVNRQRSCRGIAEHAHPAELHLPETDASAVVPARPDRKNFAANYLTHGSVLRRKRGRHVTRNILPHNRLRTNVLLEGSDAGRPTSTENADVISMFHAPIARCFRMPARTRRRLSEYAQRHWPSLRCGVAMDPMNRYPLAVRRPPVAAGKRRFKSCQDCVAAIRAGGNQSKDSGERRNWGKNSADAKFYRQKTARRSNYGCLPATKSVRNRKNMGSTGRTSSQ